MLSDLYIVYRILADLFLHYELYTNTIAGNPAYGQAVNPAYGRVKVHHPRSKVYTPPLVIRRVIWCDKRDDLSGTAIFCTEETATLNTEKSFMYGN